MKKTFLSIFLLFAVCICSLSCKTAEGKISADGRFRLIPVDADKVVKTIEQYQKEHNYWFATNYFSVPFNEPLQIFVSKEAVADVGRKNISGEGVEQDTSANVSIYIGYKKDAQWILNRYEGKQEIIYKRDIYSFAETKDIALVEKEFLESEALYRKRIELLGQDQFFKKTKSINADYETHSDDEIMEVLRGVKEFVIADLSNEKIDPDKYLFDSITVRVDLFNFNKLSYFNAWKRMLIVTYMCNNEIRQKCLTIKPKTFRSNEKSNDISEVIINTKNFKLSYIEFTQYIPSNQYVSPLRLLHSGIDRLNKFYCIIEINLKELKIK